MNATRRRWLTALTLMLLAIAAARGLRLGGFWLDNDEVWTVWMTAGTPAQIIQRTSPTETPLFYLIMAGWQSLTGISPETARYLSLLLGLPGVALMYRAARRLGASDWAGALAALAYGAPAISTFIGLYTRSYVLAYSGLPLALWLLLRYFDRPGWRRGLLLGVSLALLYYATVTAVLPAALLGGFALLRYGRQSWRGWLPALTGLLLVLPDVLTSKQNVVGAYSSVERMIPLGPLPGAALEFISFFFSAPAVWWLLLTVSTALALLGLRHLRPGQWRTHFFWLLWAMGVPLLLYALEARLGFYNFKRYAWWYVFGIALLIGLNLVRLPRAGRWAAAGVLFALLLVPFRLNTYGYLTTPMGENLRWLRDHARAGDAVLLDPASDCLFPEEWDYYTRLYFPNRLPVVSSDDGVRRLWLARGADAESLALEARIARGRIPGRFVGPPDCLFRLYESPPPGDGVLFENGLRLLGMELLDGEVPFSGPFAFREGDTLSMRLWWTVDRPLPLDYSIGLFVYNTTLILQDDRPPQLIYPDDASSQTSTWQPGQIYVERRDLQLPSRLSRGQLALFAAVYWYGDGQRIAAPGMNEVGLLPLGRYPVVSW